MNEIANLHTPVMRERCVDLITGGLPIGPSVVVDATLGMGGHTESLLESNQELTVIGIDRDPQAIDLATRRLERFGSRFIPVEAIFDEIDEVVMAAGFDQVHGILADFGVSSLQLDDTERGFSYSVDAELDMRMNNQTGETAAALIAKSSVDQLTQIIRDYGEEKFAHRIAIAIKKTNPTRSADLNKIVSQVVPFTPGKSSGHPAKRVYQALRIAVNDELGAIERFIPAAVSVMASGARIVLMSYHSLEDGIVKRELRAFTESSAPIDLPVELPSHRATMKMLTRGVERASERELESNPRSASARLRAAEMLGENQ